MASYLPRIERPRGLVLKIAYFVLRRQLGKVPTPIAVFSARMPLAFLLFSGKISRLDRKLKLPAPTAVLVREQVAGVNGCSFCQDITRWFTMRTAPGELARIDALPTYRTSLLFTDAERAALDYATELTRERHVEPATFERLTRHYSEREICDIVWLVASEHFYNMANHGLAIGTDGLCELRTARSGRAPVSAAADHTP
jgi:alkylhydroperoxidase family enzyme